jgi:hypothetical protein
LIRGTAASSCGMEPTGPVAQSQGAVEPRHLRPSKEWNCVAGTRRRGSLPGGARTWTSPHENDGEQKQPGGTSVATQPRGCNPSRRSISGCNLGHYPTRGRGCKSHGRWPILGVTPGCTLSRHPISGCNDQYPTSRGCKSQPPAISVPHSQQELAAAGSTRETKLETHSRNQTRPLRPRGGTPGAGSSRVKCHAMSESARPGESGRACQWRPG